MAVVAAYIYRDGARVREVSLDAPETLSMDEHEFVWIGLADPTDEELAILQQKFGLHPLAVEDAQHAHQMPKVDVYGSQMFVVTRTAHLEAGRIAYGETAIFLGPRFIISARHGSTRGHIELRHQLEAAPTLLQHGVDYVLHAILDFIVDGYSPVVETIEDEVLEMERRALDTFLGREEVTRIFTVRRDLMKFRRVLGPMEEMAGRLTHLDFPCLDAEVKPYFRDVLDHVRRVQSRVAGLGEVLTSVFEVSGLLETQRQSAITRKLAAWAAILAVPTAVAGIYGMNFDIMPELRWRFGYPAVIAFIGVVCLFLYFRFKREKWL